jgi:proline dehydrogenase
METSAVARRLAARFVAGETLDEALAAARKLTSQGIHVTLNHLGENITNLEEAAAARDVYLETLAALHNTGISGHISVKLTHLGIDYSFDRCLANVETLARQAREWGGFVRVDMESSAYTSRTLHLVSSLFRRYPVVGAVIQAYLYRSRKDAENLCAQGIPVRLCKGAYLEPKSVAYTRKTDVDRSFVDLMKLLLTQGTNPAIATHDEGLIEETKRWAWANRIPREAFEFEMLYGIRRDLQQKLVAEGYRLRLYLPFGTAWYPYYMRRLGERPANVLFILRNLFRQ